MTHLSILNPLGHVCLEIQINIRCEALSGDHFEKIEHCEFKHANFGLKTLLPEDFSM